MFVKPNSHAHWPTCTKRGTNVAKGNSCNLSEKIFFSGEPPLRYRAEKRRGEGIPSPRLFSALYLRGGFTGKKYFFAQITAIAFSYIRTAFGASRSMRVGVRFDKH